MQLSFLQTESNLPGIVLPVGIVADCLDFAERLWPTVKDVRAQRHQHDGTAASESKNKRQDASAKEAEFAAHAILAAEGRLLTLPDTTVYYSGKSFGPDLFARDGGRNVHVKQVSVYWHRERGPSIVVQAEDRYLRSGNDLDLLAVMHRRRGRWSMMALCPSSIVPQFLSPMEKERYRDNKNAVYINDLPREFLR